MRRGGECSPCLISSSIMATSHRWYRKVLPAHRALPHTALVVRPLLRIFYSFKGCIHQHSPAQCSSSRAAINICSVLGPLKLKVGINTFKLGRLLWPLRLRQILSEREREPESVWSSEGDEPQDYPWLSPTFTRLTRLLAQPFPVWMSLIITVTLVTCHEAVNTVSRHKQYPYTWHIL